MNNKKITFQEFEDLVKDKNIDITASEKIANGDNVIINLCYIDNRKGLWFREDDSGLIVEVLNAPYYISVVELSRRDYAKLKLLYMTERNERVFK